jgi:hypothetical protein
LFWFDHTTLACRATAIVEGFPLLKTALMRQGAQTPFDVFVILSTIVEEGNSISLHNRASAFAVWHIRLRLKSVSEKSHEQSTGAKEGKSFHDAGIDCRHFKT